MKTLNLLLAACILILPLWTSAATNLADIAPTRGFKIVGANAGDALGAGLADMGDLNGDGRSDVAIGAPETDRAGPVANVGAVYVIFGSAAPTHPFDVSTLNGSNGFKLIDNNALTGSLVGAIVGPAGDVNHDSLPDFWVGTGSFLNAGPAYVVFGRAMWPAVLDLSTLDGGNGFKVFPSAALSTSGLGTAIAGGSDLNGDEIDDLVFGAPNANTTTGQTLGGRVYVVLGRSSLTVPPIPYPATFSPDNLASGVILFQGLSSDFLGFSVDMGADFNNDGRPDLMASAIGTPENGKAYVVYARAKGNPFNPINSMPTTANFSVFGSVTNNGDGFGAPAKFLRDINGDDIADLGVAAPDHTFAGGPTSVGTMYVIYGGVALPATMNVGTMTVSQGFHVDGTATQDDAAENFCGPGDITGDGIGDLLIGVSRADVGPTLNTGKVYVVNGVSGTRPLIVPLAAVDAATLDGEVFQSNTANIQFGLNSGAGLFDGDVMLDFLVASPIEGSFGEVYLIHKSVGGFANGFEDP